MPQLPATPIPTKDEPTASPRAEAKKRVSLRAIIRSLQAAHRSAADSDHHRADRVVSQCRALLSERGEASGRRGALEAIAAYRSLNESERRTFFVGLLEEFSPSREALGRAIDAFQKNPSHATVLALELAAAAPRQELFRRFNMAPGGTQALLDMRRDLSRVLEHNPDFNVIDADLVHIFRSWFNRGFLILQRIDWRTSALILERLIQYEAVHQITSWRDLRRRLEADRRCYAFFHPALPDEPLIFIEIALTRGMTTRIQGLIDPDSAIVDPSRADCAMFYSVTSCQEGLRGISFGNFLIKQVVEDLGVEFRRLRTFATLSPIPQFRPWFEAGRGSDRRPEVSKKLEEWVAALNGGAAIDETKIAPPLREELTFLCAWYLMNAKRGKTPFDPVARFHLANGARLEQLNWLGDTSETGMRRSFGLTVNYVYRLADLERNHEQYATDARVVASREFTRLLRRSEG